MVRNQDRIWASDLGIHIGISHGALTSKTPARCSESRLHGHIRRKIDQDARQNDYEQPH
jgi:hypothetical protein